MTFSRDEAVQLLMDLKLGAKSVADVIEWANQQVAATDPPSVGMIDLCMMGSSRFEEVARQLESMVGPFDPWEALPVWLGRVHSEVLEHPDRAPLFARRLYHLCVDANYEIPQGLKRLLYFDDAFSLAEAGTHGSVAGVLHEFLEFTGAFAESAANS